jgi:predicted nucleic acid-binding protein
MIVISDTSPLNYLILIGQENLLPTLFGQVCVPQTVFDELSAEGASVQVRSWAQTLPSWIEIKQTNLTALSMFLIQASEKRFFSLKNSPQIY